MLKKEKVQNMFNNIAGKYDFLNHFLSMGIDFYWRKKAIKLTGMDNKSILLDVACGTGDFSLTAYENGVENIFGSDFSINMIKIFPIKHKKIDGLLTNAAAEYMPYKDSSFSNITVAFGVRNFYNIPQAFNEFLRILTPNGKVTVLEFQLPKNIIIRKLYVFYFNKILPFLGGVISGDFSAYKYLPDSVKEFDEKVNLVDMFNKAGFSKISKTELTFGVVQVVIAEKS